ncbi:MAG: hypothetical protein ACRD21_14450 [Vicinamibacteria bacterium]
MGTTNAIALAVLLVPAMVGGGERRPVLELVWLDAHGLFPDFERVRCEAGRIFRDVGVDVRWEIGTDPRPAGAGERRIHVVLMPSEPSGWGISPDAMGVFLVPASARQDAVYLFYRPILRNLGLGRRDGAMLEPRERRDVARAIARVVVHEVVHALAPRLAHSEEGIMHDSLLPSTLASRSVGIDARIREEIVRGLRESSPR